MYLREGSREPPEGTGKGGNHPEGCKCMACGTHRTFESLLRQPKTNAHVGKSASSYRTDGKEGPSTRILKEWNSDVNHARADPHERTAPMEEKPDPTRNPRVRNASSGRAYGHGHQSGREGTGKGEDYHSHGNGKGYLSSKTNNTYNERQSSSRDNTKGNGSRTSDTPTGNGYDPLQRRSTREEQLTMQQIKQRELHYAQGGNEGRNDVMTPLGGSATVGRPPRPNSRGGSAPRAISEVQGRDPNSRSNLRSPKTNLNTPLGKSSPVPSNSSPQNTATSYQSHAVNSNNNSSVLTKSGNPNQETSGHDHRLNSRSSNNPNQDSRGYGNESANVMPRSGSSRSFGRTNSRGKVALRRLNQDMRATHNVVRKNEPADTPPLHHTWERTGGALKPGGGTRVIRRIDRMEKNTGNPRGTSSRGSERARNGNISNYGSEDFMTEGTATTSGAYGSHTPIPGGRIDAATSSGYRAPPRAISSQSNKGSTTYNPNHYNSNNYDHASTASGGEYSQGYNPKAYSSKAAAKGNQQLQQRYPTQHTPSKGSHDASSSSRHSAGKGRKIEYTIPPDAEEYDEMQLYPCNVCGRSFNGEALKKHAKVCKKVFVNKRKEFNIKAFRAPEDALQFQQTAGKERGRDRPEKSSKDNKWRLKSQAFREAIRQSQCIKQAMDGKREMPAFQPTPVELDDRTQCPHCSRRFNSEAAERHIPKCQDIKAKPTRLMRSTNPLKR